MTLPSRNTAEEAKRSRQVALLSLDLESSVLDTTVFSITDEETEVQRDEVAGRRRSLLSSGQPCTLCSI